MTTEVTSFGLAQLFSMDPRSEESSTEKIDTNVTRAAFISWQTKCREESSEKESTRLQRIKAGFNSLKLVSPFGIHGGSPPKLSFSVNFNLFMAAVITLLLLLSLPSSFLPAQSHEHDSLDVTLTVDHNEWGLAHISYMPWNLMLYLKVKLRPEAARIDDDMVFASLKLSKKRLKSF